MFTQKLISKTRFCFILFSFLLLCSCDTTSISSISPKIIKPNRSTKISSKTHPFAEYFNIYITNKADCAFFIFVESNENSENTYINQKETVLIKSNETINKIDFGSGIDTQSMKMKIQISLTKQINSDKFFTIIKDQSSDLQLREDK